MTLRQKHEKLRRPCIKCNKYFIPTSKQSRVCLKCFQESRNKAIKLGVFRYRKLNKLKEVKK